MVIRLWIGICALFVGATSWSPVWAGGEDAAPTQTGIMQRGRLVYVLRCAECHGRDGRGDGRAAAFMTPRPRDFTTGAFKIRSTASGELPTDKDLFRTVTRGMPGTRMPAWDFLPAADRLAVVAYLKTFSPAFAKSAPPSPMAEGRPIRMTEGSVARGRALYDELKCGDCHGAEGRGDGTSSHVLVDEWGHSIRPADLTRPWTFRGGADAGNIYLRLTTGMNGSPMPAFADAVPEADRRRLANFIRSLAREPSAEELRQGEDAIWAARYVAARSRPTPLRRVLPVAAGLATLGLELAILRVLKSRRPMALTPPR